MLPADLWEYREPQVSRSVGDQCDFFSFCCYGIPSQSWKRRSKVLIWILLAVRKLPSIDSFRGNDNVDGGINPRIFGHVFALHLHLGVELVVVNGECIIPGYCGRSAPLRKFRRGPFGINAGSPLLLDR